jgi:hypothetical protein
LNGVVPGRTERGGSGMSASVARVFAFISRSLAPSSEPHSATIWLWLSKVIDAHSSSPSHVERTPIALPSGPRPEYASVMYASLWMLLRPFGAMNG